MIKVTLYIAELRHQTSLWEVLGDDIDQARGLLADRSPRYSGHLCMLGVPAIACTKSREELADAATELYEILWHLNRHERPSLDAGVPTPSVPTEEEMNR